MYECLNLELRSTRCTYRLPKEGKISGKQQMCIVEGNNQQLRKPRRPNNADFKLTLTWKTNPHSVSYNFPCLWMRIEWTCKAFYEKQFAELADTILQHPVLCQSFRPKIHCTSLSYHWIATAPPAASASPRPRDESIACEQRTPIYSQIHRYLVDTLW